MGLAAHVLAMDAEGRKSRETMVKELQEFPGIPAALFVERVLHCQGAERARLHMWVRDRHVLEDDKFGQRQEQESLKRSGTEFLSRSPVAPVRLEAVSWAREP